jgi:hypothetical protein
MTRNIFRKNKTQLVKYKTTCGALLSIVLIASTLIISLSLLSATSAEQSIKSGGTETQFNLDVAYAYVGKCTTNTSYTDNGLTMSLVSNYPSAVVLNITRIPGNQIASCSGEIEVFGIQVNTDTGIIENHAYFVGTNYDPSFSGSELSTLAPRVNDLVDKNVYTEIRGNFDFNWTDNTSIMSHPVGSVGCYSNAPSSAGLWSAGKPNAISVTIQRIGYITIKNGLVSVFKNAPTSNIVATTRLSAYGDGLMHNTLINSDKLPQTDLFHPEATNTVLP